jgi:hypothetical protein
LKIVYKHLINLGVFLVFFSFSFLLLHIQVECKKAQPKEVMLPANIAKTRTAGRGTYGELVVLSGAPPGSLGAVGTPTATLRYTPYPLPAMTNQQAAATTAHILPLQATSAAPQIIQYATHSSQLYDASMPYKRFYAASAAASMRPHHPNLQPQRAAPTLTYQLGDLLSVQGLDVSALYHHHPLQTATIGL